MTNFADQLYDRQDNLVNFLFHYIGYLLSRPGPSAAGPCACPALELRLSCPLGAGLFPRQRKEAFSHPQLLGQNKSSNLCAVPLAVNTKYKVRVNQYFRKL